VQIDLKQLVTTTYFRAHAAELFDAIGEGATYVITRSGRPIAVVKPVDDPPAPAPISVERPASNGFPRINPGYSEKVHRPPNPASITPIDLD
jgi:antitoxin (DNA-binding transcriptional repressor) of toxin-antitoxin stability system